MKAVFFLLLLAAPAAAEYAVANDTAVFRNGGQLVSSHFLIRHEDSFAPAGVLNALESLHAKLLIDLGGFAPWAYSEKIEVFLYKDAASYSKYSGGPPWAGGHINLNKRRIYAYPSKNFNRTMAHELGHLFFSQYFIAKSTVPPLWLNEGVATMMEWDYGMQEDAQRVSDFLLREGVIPFGAFVRGGYGHGGEEDGEKISHWYRQAQSVTRFLLRQFPRSQFLAFCAALRDGRSIDEALRAGYGLVMADGETLERLWRESLKAPR